MNYALLIALLAAASQANIKQSDADRESRIRKLIDSVAQSGRVLEAGDAEHRLKDPRTEVAPGAPPLLSFRYFEGAARHRFGNLDLVIDDAGH